MIDAMKQPTVSIIIPVYNEELDIRECLKAIARQSVRPDEVIVVDNNSTDWSVAVARQFDFVKVITESKQGIAFARNAGFNAVKSDIIARIDADSRLHKDWVKRLKRYYSSPVHQNRAVSGSGYFYNVFLPDSFGRLQHAIAFKYNKVIMGSYILWGSNMALPKTLWKEVKTATSTRTDIHEDIDLAIQLQRRGYKIDYRKSLITGVRMRRVHSDRHKLWPNLMMWPRTFKVHGYSKWPLALAGAVALFIASLPLRIIESIYLQFKQPHPRAQTD